MSLYTMICGGEDHYFYWTPRDGQIYQTSLNSEDANLELAKTMPTIVHTFVASADSSVAADISTVIDITRFSALMKLLRVTALVLKFIDLCGSFESELQSLHGQSVVTLLQKQLNLFLDKEGIIRCQGRIDHSAVP